MVGPSFGSQFSYLPVCGEGQPGENVKQVSIRIESTASAAFDYGVEDGATLSGLGFANEQPVFLSKSSWSDGIFAEVVVDFGASVIKVTAEQGPVV